MNVILACYDGFSCCSMTYIVNFANELVRQGHSVVVAVPTLRSEELNLYSKGLFCPLSFDQALTGDGFADRRPAEILHAWTPRESVRSFCSDYMGRHGTPLVIHLEDDEDHIRERFLSHSQESSRASPDQAVPGNVSHATRHKIFMQLASGFTLVWPSLADFLPKGVPFLHVPLSVDPDRFAGAPSTSETEAKFGIEPQEKIILYAGGLNECLREDQESLYEAILILNRSGLPCRLFRTGPGTVGTAELLAEGSSPHVLEAGFVAFLDLVGLMQRADLFVQPGKSTNFNRYRMPGKIPEFMHAGTPLVIPACNVGGVLRDGEEAILLKEGSAEEIAHACREIFQNPDLAKRLGRGARKAGERLFSLVENTRRLAEFYRKVISENKSNPVLLPVARAFREFTFLQAALQKALDKNEPEEIQRVAAQLRAEIEKGSGGDAVRAQLFWAAGDESFSEINSESIPYLRDVPAQIRFRSRPKAEGDLRFIRFRLDPAMEPGRLILYRVRVFDEATAELLADWHPPTWEVVVGGDLASQNGASGLFLSYGNDPYLIFPPLVWQGGGPLVLEVACHWQTRPEAMADVWSKMGKSSAFGSLKRDLQESIQAFRALADRQESRLVSIQAAVEERAREWASEQRHIEQRIKELGSYLGQVHNMAFSPWLNYVPAPLSWPFLLFKARSIQRPLWFPRVRTNQVRPKPGFWRRLERSIRKRRKKWMAAWGFDAQWYLENNPDVRAAGLNPLAHYLQFGLREGRKKNASDQPSPAAKKEMDVTAYEMWIQKYENLTEKQRMDFRLEASRMGRPAKISILIPTYHSQIRWLELAIQSVMRQIYPHWELVVCDDGSNQPELREYLEKLPSRDPRIRVFFLKERGHISAACNRALAEATAEWAAVLDHDDELHEAALYHVAQTIQRHPGSALIYSDEDKITPEGRRFDPYFKSDYDRVLMWGQNMITHLAVIKTSVLREIGGFRKGFEGAQDYDLFLRITEQVAPDAICHIPRVLYHWRAHPQSTAMGAVTASGETAKPYALVASEKAVNDHLERTRMSFRVVADTKLHMHRLRPLPTSDRPKVSILIPTRNQGRLVANCVHSIFDSTKYNMDESGQGDQNFEVLLLDNGTDQKEDLRLFKCLEEKYPKFKKVCVPGSFNYSKINNQGVSLTSSELLCLLNNDTEVIEESWLRELAALAAVPWVGAVGAKLLFPDRTIQHAGVVTGIGGSAAHVLKGSPEESLGYFCRATLPSRFSAVTGACLMVKKADYLGVGGLDEEDFRVAFNDVDFCLKLEAKGKVNVLNPAAVLIHHESKSRGYEDNPQKQARFNLEKENLLAKWGRRISVDPWYNPNLSLEQIDYSLASPPRI